MATSPGDDPRDATAPPIDRAADGDITSPGVSADRGWRPPAHHVRVCLVESCQPQGGRELRGAIEERLGIRVDERTPDGSISLEGLECIGLCGMAEAVLVDDEPVIGWDSVMQAVDKLPD